MLTPSTSSFFMLKLNGNAADQVTAALSPGSMLDVTEVLMISGDFTQEMQAEVSMNTLVQHLKENLPDSVIETEKFNPLYLPTDIKTFDALLDVVGPEGEEVTNFIGMDGNPFTSKMIDIQDGEEHPIQGKLMFQPFEMPSYDQITASIKGYLPQ